MKILFILLVLASCGKKKQDKHCLSRFQKMQECFSEYNETHDPYYVEMVCGEKFPEEGCYK